DVAEEEAGRVPGSLLIPGGSALGPGAQAILEDRGIAGPVVEEARYQADEPSFAVPLPGIPCRDVSVGLGQGGGSGLGLSLGSVAQGDAGEGPEPIGSRAQACEAGLIAAPPTGEQEDGADLV